MPRVAPSIRLDRMQQRQLQQLVKAPSTPQRLVLRGRIILAAANQQWNQEIAGTLGIPEITASKWRRRFARLGLQGLQDAPRAGRPPRHGPEVWEKVQRRACQQPESQSRWSVRTLARELRLPSTTVHTILAKSHWPPHRSRTFTFSPDPEFEAKLLDVVGLYLNPPDNALLLCVDEKTGIQALERTQPLLPLRAKKPRRWTHEYVRHGPQRCWPPGRSPPARSWLPCGSGAPRWTSSTSWMPSWPMVPIGTCMGWSITSTFTKIKPHRSGWLAILVSIFTTPPPTLPG